MRKFLDAIFYLIVFIVIQFFVTYAVCAVWAVAEGIGNSLRSLMNGEGITTTQTIVIQVISSIITLVIFLSLKWCRVSRAYLRSKPYGVLFWAGVAVLGTVIPSEVFLELVPLPDLTKGTLGDILGSRWGYLVVCIFAPIVEEVVFRGAILRVLLEGTKGAEASRVKEDGVPQKEGAYRHWVAIAISALLFALVHGNPAQMPHAFCIGLLLGWMFYRTGSIIPGIMLHWVNNTLSYVVYNLFPQYQDAKVIDLLGGDMLKVSLAIVFSLFIFIPAVYQLHLRMKKVED